MDYTYIKENAGKTSENAVEFVRQIERMCKALDVTLVDDKGNYKNMNNFIFDTAIAYIQCTRKIK